jgi:RNA polymerase sigma factor (sigma-70 family)
MKPSSSDRSSGGLPSPEAHANADANATPGEDDAVRLVREAASGDAVATRKLLERVAPRVVRTARAAMGAHHPEIDDAIQLALIGFIQALPSFRGECDPSLFAARIAVRAAGAVRRRSRARCNRVDPSVEVDMLQGKPTELAASRRRAAFRNLLDDLPEEQAEALALRFMVGWSLAELAEATGAPLNTVRSRLRLGKEALRRRIEGDPALAEELETMELGL